MPVKKDASGRRYVQAEVEVPGTPEEVWRAIATGPGVSSWFVPTTIEERAGGTTTASFGPGMDAVGTITSWEPPRRYTVESPGDGPNDPTVATEWTVEARSGGTCVVRVVHGWFASTDDWDNQFEGHEHGWVAFFRVLRLSLAYFRGQQSAAFQVMAMAPGPVPDAWAALIGPLGLSGASEGARVQSAAEAPRLAGVVERIGPLEYPELLVRLDQPAPGIAHLFALSMGGQVILSIRLYPFGPDAPAAAAREEQSWQSWLGVQFPAPGAARAVAEGAR